MTSDNGKLAWIVPSAAAAILVLAGAAFFSSMSHDAPARPVPTPAQTKSTAKPIHPSDPKLYGLEFNFCLDADKVTKLEAPLVSGPLKATRAANLVHQAQVIAQKQADEFLHAGYDGLGKQIQEWADAFAHARVALLAGTDPVKAIHPPVQAESAVERTIDCQGDA